VEGPHGEAEDEVQHVERSTREGGEQGMYAVSGMFCFEPCCGERFVTCDVYSNAPRFWKQQRAVGACKGVLSYYPSC
jgi:hypothetical protein